ncbi:hypothetical protein N9K32_00880, partial [bacterium]|nr:hypothetical protein [bacterium]
NLIFEFKKENFLEPSVANYNSLFIRKIIKITLMFSLIFFISPKLKKIFLSIYISIILPYIILTFNNGLAISERIFFRGGDILLNTTILIMIFISLTKLDFFKKIILSNYLKVISFFLIFIFFFIAFLGQFHEKINNSYVLNKDFKQVYKWINKNTDKEDTFITLDPELITNLPVYSKINIYMSQDLIGRSDINGRLIRFIEICNFYGLDTNNIKTLQSELKNKLSDENEKIYHNTIKNYNNIIFARNKNFLLQYKEKFSKISKSLDKNINFNFDNDYIILSNFDKMLINLNGNINKFLNKSNLLYQNKSYSIFKILNS